MADTTTDMKCILHTFDKFQGNFVFKRADKAYSRIAYVNALLIWLADGCSQQTVHRKTI